MNWRHAAAFAIVALPALMLAAFAAQPPPVYEAPNAVVPERPAPIAVPNTETPAQTIQRTVPTLDEEIAEALAHFQGAYAHAKKPRILVLFNRDMEDNDKDTMVKTQKVQTGTTTVKKENGRTTRERTEGGAATFDRAPGSPNAYRKMDMEAIRGAFEQPFVNASARMVDRETAVRMHGLKEEEVFSYIDLPEAQRAQVAGVKEYADLLVTVRVERGETVVRKVSGDYRVEVPNMIVRAIRLSDAQVVATAKTSDVQPGNPDETATRVAIYLMQRLADTWGMAK
jgi:hypothetical protein